MPRTIDRDQLLAALRACVDEHGHASPSANEVVDLDGVEVPIGRRVAYLRRAYRQGRLSPELIDNVEDLPGWRWDPWAESKRARLNRIAGLAATGTSIPSVDRDWLSRQVRLGRTRDGTHAHDLRFSRPVARFLRCARAWLDENPGATLEDLTARSRVSDPETGQSVTIGRSWQRYLSLRTDEGGRFTASELAELRTLPGWPVGSVAITGQPHDGTIGDDPERRDDATDADALS